MGERKYRVILCEDEPLLLANLKKKIENLLPDFEVVGTAEDGDTAAFLLNELAADVLVTDIRVPGLDGLELIRIVANHHQNMKTLVISGYGDFAYAKHAIRYGVTDYLLKPISSGELEEAFAKVRTQLDRAQAGFTETSARFSPDRFHSPKAVALAVQDYIRNNYMREINVQILSDRFHLNPSYLCRVFSKYVGETPTKYITSIRIDMAKSILVKNPVMFIRDVGELVGYPDQFYFSRVFKQTVGKSPESYRSINP